MTGRQRGLVALIVAILVVVVGLGGFLAWAAFNHGKEEKAALKPALAASASTSSETNEPGESGEGASPTQIDGYSKDFNPTQAQKTLAITTVKAVVPWKQTESASQREKRLSKVCSKAVASQEPIWQSMSGQIPGAWIEVLEVDEPATSTNDGHVIGVGVMVTYRLHIPHNDGTEVIATDTALWVVEMPAKGKVDKATAVIWPKL
ncbi:hypothetical protein HMPREF0045_01292 [Actinomyces graevenitzii C83]|uniref:Uncharacterized protein n=1 Tax=Actinomyces graevenitzii C83 TaxID=435830 RepID=G9PGB8_9ACTO|nr:hypothetical protein [Actinomyces graevenitzii]EHM87887.1 hypothetical protein HMPREF0045_01292 [Actinomyces graevenitzii C83]